MPAHIVVAHDDASFLNDVVGALQGGYDAIGYPESMATLEALEATEYVEIILITRITFPEGTPPWCGIGADGSDPTSGCKSAFHCATRVDPSRGGCWGNSRHAGNGASCSGVTNELPTSRILRYDILLSNVSLRRLPLPKPGRRLFSLKKPGSAPTLCQGFGASALDCGSFSSRPAEGYWRPVDKSGLHRATALRVRRRRLRPPSRRPILPWRDIHRLGCQARPHSLPMRSLISAR